MLSESERNPKAAGFVGGCGNLRGGDGLEGFLHGFHHLDGFAAAAGTDACGCAVDGAQQHFFAASAAGEQAYADFD